MCLRFFPPPRVFSSSCLPTPASHATDLGLLAHPNTLPSGVCACFTATACGVPGPCFAWHRPPSCVYRFSRVQGIRQERRPVVLHPGTPISSDPAMLLLLGGGRRFRRPRHSFLRVLFMPLNGVWFCSKHGFTNMCACVRFIHGPRLAVLEHIGSWPCCPSPLLRHHVA